jgi:anti-sigma factor RsiW
MTRCDLIAPLLPRVADGDAEPAETVCVARHIETCTCCGILLARERRLSETIETMRNIEVGDLFTRAVMDRLPAKLQKRKRDRRGLRLAGISGAIALATVLASATRSGWNAGIPSAAPPSLPADIADPAAGSMIALAQMVLMALQSVVEAPLVASVAGGTWLLILIVVCSTLAATAFGSTLLAVYFLRSPTPET